MAGIPAWQAARGGLPGDPGATDASAQINQLLGSHPVNVLYAGNPILTPDGTGGFPWDLNLGVYDVDQPFTMSGTNIGRVSVPLLPVGNGADLIVTLSTDASGYPGTAIQTTRIPAAWITQFAAVAGTGGLFDVTAPALHLTGSPLALGQYCTLWSGFTQDQPYPYPAAYAGGVPAGNPASTYAGNCLIQIGGDYGSGPTFVPDVFTITYAGGGAINSPVVQPAMPVPNSRGAAVAVTTTTGDTASTVVVAGGPDYPPTAAVYTAGLNSATGSIDSWSSQTVLPQAVYDTTAATFGDFVYVVGGSGSTSILSTLYWAQVTNGQITTWNTTSLPTTIYSSYTTVSNGFLFVVGGNTGSGAVANAWYAPLDPGTGAPGSWQAAPPLPVATTSGAGSECASTPFGIVVKTSSTMYTLGVGPDGPATNWMQQAIGGVADTALFPGTPGTWQYVSVSASSYTTSVVSLTPMISVPLPAAGLTSGATYHLTLRQGGGDLNDFLLTHFEFGAFPGNPTILTRMPNTTAGWTAPGGSGGSIPLAVFDQTPGGQPWHTWSDAGARISTLVWATTPDQRLLGIADATQQAGPVLNMNATFTAGVAPWAAHGGTVAQSSAHTRGNLPSSAQVTPSGSAANVYIECELVPVLQGHSYTVTGWMYSQPGYANASLDINWYDHSSAYLSTTSGTTTALPAATWTQLSTTAAVPASAAYATVAAGEHGTPAVTAVFSVSAAAIQDASGPMLGSVAQVIYPGVWPGVTAPPLAVTPLA